MTIAAKATILATGGLTRLYRRNSASANMGGDGYALALRAGAPLIDMEFVQFFPIGHLAPRLIGMDPIMWDPFRYKLGGRLLNSEGEEFTARYGATEDGTLCAPRAIVATYAIVKEVEAGRGSPHGGAFLSFEHCSAAALRDAFGPVIDRLASEQHRSHQHAGRGCSHRALSHGRRRRGRAHATELPGLLVAGEAVGGANGANRLSGNAITEALVFGRRAGLTAAERAKQRSRGAFRPQAARARSISSTAERGQAPVNTAAMIAAPASRDGERCRPVPHRREARTRSCDD